MNSNSLKENCGGSSKEQANARFYWLDWLRFIAAFMVVACHARGTNWVEWGRLESAYQSKAAYLFFAGTRAGLEWVIVFFVLSGFLVGGKVLERTRDGIFDAKAYALDRVSRIWLPLFPALLLTAAVGCILGLPLSVAGLLGNLFGLQGVLCWSFGGNFPLWSLAYEVWFYLLAGCAAVAISSRSQSRLWAYLGMTIGVLVFTRLDATFLFCWVLGAVSYSQLGVKRNRFVLMTGLLAVAGGFVLSQLNSETVSLDKAALLTFLPSQSVATLILSAGIAFVLPSLCLVRPASTVVAALERFGGRLAAFSYTLYLTHYPLLGLWGRLIPERHTQTNLVSMLHFISVIGFCLFAAWVLYLPFEGQTSFARNWIRSRLSLRGGGPVVPTDNSV